MSPGFNGHPVDLVSTRAQFQYVQRDVEQEPYRSDIGDAQVTSLISYSKELSKFVYVISYYARDGIVTEKSVR